MDRHPGFTLIELMVALVVASILLLVAVPGYQQTVLRSGRAAGKGVLLDVLSRQEQFFVNNKKYATTLAQLGLPSAYYVDRQANHVSANDAIYRIELDVVSSQFSAVVALPQNRQGRDVQCMSFALGRTGAKTVTGLLASTPLECW